ncbi:MAG: nitroreductase family protein [bacterium]|nr:nitroreductase family protein [bacterium]
MRPGSYAAWTVRETDFPRGGRMEEQLRFLLRYAVLAPSAHNTQPWTFRVEGNHLSILPEFSRALPVSDPTHRELYVSLGCALANLRVAAEHFGFRVAEEDFPGGSDQPVARLSFVSGGTEPPGNDALFAAIPKRHTNRAPYESRAVPVDLLQRFRGQVTDPDVRLDLVTQLAHLRTIAELTAQATRDTLGRADFRSELSRWVRNNFTKQSDGMPGFAVGVPDAPSLLARVMVHLPPMAKAEAKKAQTLIAGGPLLAVFSTKEDAPHGWVKAGVAFERVWLAAVAHGLRAAPYAGPFEASALHEDVERLLGISGFRSQTLLRIGYGPDDPHPSPRRDVREVVLTTK